MVSKKTRKLIFGGKENVRMVEIGGGAPIAVQTMWKEPLHHADIVELAKKIGRLEMLGCDVLRFAVPDELSADVFVKLCRICSMPLVADIHFDYRLALKCMDAPVGAVRINPGNIGGENRVRAVVEKAKQTKTPLRIGVNSGSLPKDIARSYPNDIAMALVKTAEREVAFFEAENFRDFAVSMKASSVEDTVKANEIFAGLYDVPLHLGVTEAGPLISGVVKSSVAFYRLLSKGIGDTIRVSLSDTCESELIAAREILSVCGMSRGGIRLVSCPRCGRNGFDVHGFVTRWEHRLFSLTKNITVAIMGCEVNGPGEAKHADIGITGSKEVAVIFKHGKVVQRLNLKGFADNKKIQAIDTAFEKELSSL